METERRRRHLRARDSAELRLVASGFATQDLWLGNRKVRSQVVGENQSRFSVRGTVGKIKREER